MEWYGIESNRIESRARVSKKQQINLGRRIGREDKANLGVLVFFLDVFGSDFRRGQRK